VGLDIVRVHPIGQLEPAREGTVAALEHPVVLVRLLFSDFFSFDREDVI
jgi:hypothetical protein